MPVCLPRSIYLHVPKMAGSWHRSVLRPHALHETSRHHLTADHIRQEDWFDGRSLFCSVRNPVDWYVSYWMHRTRTNWPDIPELSPVSDMSKQLGQCREESVDAFLLRAAVRCPGWLGRYSALWADDCTEYVKVETLPDGLQSALDRMGENIVIKNLAPLNVSDNRVMASAAARRAILKSEADYCRRYGY